MRGKGYNVEKVTMDYRSYKEVEKVESREENRSTYSEREIEIERSRRIGFLKSF